MAKIVECVPNFSEGGDEAVVAQITDAIASAPGVTLLDVDPGADTNRTVVTFVGDPEAVAEGAFRGIAKAAQVIDMATHHGAHPRMGATDVCPFVPVEGVTLEDCADIARRLGERVGRELAIPVYLYEAAAARPERRNLAVVRRGEYEGLPAKLADPEWAPDFGPATFNARSGALITGAREFLIAYNVTLNTRDKAFATDIAFELREKGRVARRGAAHAAYGRGRILTYAEGVFPCGSCDVDCTTFDEVVAHCADVHGYDLRHVLALNDVDVAHPVGRKVYKPGTFANCKAIGWYVDGYDRAQVSINLTDYHVTPPHVVLDEARRLATERGLVVTGSEIVGLVPYEALRQAGAHYLTRQGKTAGVPATDLLRSAVYSMGLSDVAPFDADKKVLGLPRDAAGALVAMTVRDLVDEVSRDTAAPGGGSISALAGSLAAALASMVASLTHGRAPGKASVEHAGATLAPDELLDRVATEAQSVKDALLACVDADTGAFNAYLEARRLPAGPARDAAMQDGLKTAIHVPLETAERSLDAMRLADAAARHGNPNSITDGAVGVQMGFAGVRGACWNAVVNLADVTDAGFVAATQRRCATLLADARAVLDSNGEFVDAALSARVAST